MKTILITGANRGLGLEFSRQYAQAGWQVIACCRYPDRATDLNNLAEDYQSIKLECLDVADFEQIDRLAQKLTNQAIDVLLNNAGLYGDTSQSGFGKLDYQVWSDTLRVNTLAPLKMAEAFLPHLQASDKKLLVTVSSLMGSITDNTSGGSIVYRSSKAAVNAAMKSLAIDLRQQEIGVLILHPGWVKTDMGGPNALIEVDESITGMRAVIDDFSLDQTGCFLKYNGQAMAW